MKKQLQLFGRRMKSADKLTANNTIFVDFVIDSFLVDLPIDVGQFVGVKIKLGLEIFLTFF